MAKKVNNVTSCKWTVETLSLTYAIISAVITGVGILAGTGMGLYLIIMRNYYSGSDLALFCIIIGACCIPCLIIFPYSVMLIIGVIKRNHTQVFAYVVFGTIQSIILVIGSMAYMLHDKDKYSILVFVLSMISVIGLISTWITYKRLKLRALDRMEYNQQHVLYAMPN